MIEDKLKYIYDDIYRWLIFVEAKNIALITICFVIIENVMSDNFNINSKWFPVSLCIVIFLSLACALLICSMIPFLNNNSMIKKCVKKRYCKYENSNSAIFYGSIFYKHVGNTYRNILKKLSDSNANLNKFEEDLVQQIEETSTVTLIKIWFFDITIKLLLFGICSFLITFIICA